MILQVIGTPTVLAPQSTGHPVSLPETTQRPAPVKPATAEENAGSLQDRQGSPNTRFKPQKDRAAPPSALQIEIELILANQAKEQEQKILEQKYEGIKLG